MRVVVVQIDWIVQYLLLFIFLIPNIYGQMEHKMLHNAPSLDLSLIILFWNKSRNIDNENGNLKFLSIFLSIFSVN